MNYRRVRRGRLVYRWVLCMSLMRLGVYVGRGMGWL